MKVILRHFLSCSLLFGGLLLSIAGWSQSCKEVLAVSKKPSLAEMKDLVLRISSHSSIQNGTLQLNSKGKDIEFMYPLVSQIMSKLSFIIETRFPHGSDSALEHFRDKILLRMSLGLLSYREILEMSFDLSALFEKPGAFMQSDKYTREVFLEGLWKMGIYPIPMFFTPGFELRTKLFASNTPPISIVTEKFYSYLDTASFSPKLNVLHDTAHILDWKVILRSSLSGDWRSLSSNDLDQAIKNRGVLYGKIVRQALNRTSQMQIGKEVALFFIHQLFVEGRLIVEHQSNELFSVTLKNKIAVEYQKLIETGRSNDESSPLNASNFESLLRHLGLYNVEFENARGEKFKFYYGSDRPHSTFLERDRSIFLEYMQSLAKEVIPALQEIIDSYSTELNR